jgi:ADP-ribose pyrophosphatase
MSLQSQRLYNRARSTLLPKAQALPRPSLPMSNRGGMTLSASNRIIESSSVFLLMYRPIVMMMAVFLMILFSSIFLLEPWKIKLNHVESRNNSRNIPKGQPQLPDSRPYTGSPLWKTEQTLGRLVLGETAFARCDVHTVLVEGTTSENPTIIRDWIFLEERDAVNVAVVTRDNGHKFLLFQQHKYAIPGSTLAPVGGFINDGETPFHAAQREVWEELGVGSPQTQANFFANLKSSPETNPFGDSSKQSIVPRDEYGLAWGNVTNDETASWVFLGKYRTMANRGGGFVYSYLLVDAVPLVDGGGTSAYQKSGDSESQILLELTIQQVKEAVLQGLFQEVKWTATISLALLHMEKNIQ